MEIFIILHHCFLFKAAKIFICKTKTIQYAQKVTEFKVNHNLLINDIFIFCFCFEIGEFCLQNVKKAIYRWRIVV